MILEIINIKSAIASQIECQIYQYKNQQTTTKKYQIFNSLPFNKKKLYIQINEAKTGKREYISIYKNSNY